MGITDWEVLIVRNEEGFTMKPCQIHLKRMNKNLRYKKKKKKLTTEAAMRWKLATVGENASVDSMDDMA